MMSFRGLILAFIWIAMLSLATSSRPAHGQTATQVATARAIRVYGVTIRDLTGPQTVLARDAYIVSYDVECRVPAWVAYQVKREFLLGIDQQGDPADFRNEPDVSEAATIADYEGVSAAEFVKTRLAPLSVMGGPRASRVQGATTLQQAGFLTNVVPMHQTGVGGSNGLWSRLQQWIEQSVIGDSDSAVTVIAGCVLGVQPLQKVGTAADICVPPMFFTIVIRGNATSPQNLEVIAFLIPHQAGSTGGLMDFVVPVNVIEALTGLDFFTEFDDPAEEILESAPAQQSWSGPFPSERRFAPAPYILRDRRRSLDVEAEIPAAPEPAEAAYEPADDVFAEEAAAEPAPAEDLATEPAPEEYAAEPAPAEDATEPAPAEAAEPDAPSEDDRLVRVFYGTDRQRNLEADGSANRWNQFYGSRGGDLVFGYCDVSIPPVHEKGSGGIERPWLPWSKEDPEKHVMIRVIRQLDGSSEFVRDLNDALLKPDQTAREAFVYIHGFNNSFANAAHRTAQMAFDLELDMVPIMYSWPSKNRLLKYFYDKNEVERTLPHLKEFLTIVARDSKAEKIHIIAHSMGTELFRRVIEEFTQQDAGEKFEQIILAAPDINARIFTEEIAPQLQQKRLGSRTTIYVSGQDKALLASKVTNGVPRLGAAVNRRLLEFFPTIQQIDATSVDTTIEIGHAYYGDESAVIKDLRKVLQGVPTAERDLHGADRYYVFPGTQMSATVPWWDVRKGWNFTTGWDAFLERKVHALLFFCVALLGIMWLRIRLLKRRLA